MDFRLADWEHFRHPVNAEGDEAWITHIRVVTLEDGRKRILGYGEMVDVPGGPPAENVWLHPDRVPNRVRRGDNAWPRISPERARAMCKQFEPEAPEVDVSIIPEPELRARPATLEEIPQGARQKGAKANAAGFVQRATIARGPRLDQYWKVKEISDSLKLAGVHPVDRRWFAAHWITKTAQRGAKAGVTSWAFDFAYVLEDGQLKRCNSSELDAYFDH